MANFNKVFLMGNLTRDPELRYLPNSTAVCEIGLAVNRRWKDKDGQNREDTCFVDVSAFGRTAETINQYMSKGRPIFIEGRLKFDTWTAQDGGKRSKLSVVCENFQFVGGREDGARGEGGPPRGDGPREASPPRNQPSRTAPQRETPPPDAEYHTDDEIPF